MSSTKRGRDVSTKSKLWNGKKQNRGQQPDSIHASWASEGARGRENQRTSPCRMEEGEEFQDKVGRLKNGPRL